MCIKVANLVLCGIVLVWFLDDDPFYTSKHVAIFTVLSQGKYLRKCTVHLADGVLRIDKPRARWMTTEASEFAKHKHQTTATSPSHDGT